jgi:hypothetical protein
MKNPSVIAILLFALVAAINSCTNAIAQQPISPIPHPIFSEDFESGVIDHAVWIQKITGDAILKVQSHKVAHGKYALEVSSPSPANKIMAFIMARDIPAALSHHLFGRAYMYITGVPDRHIVFLTAGTAGFPNYRYLEVASAHRLFQLTYVNSSDSGVPGEDYHAGSLVPLNRWFLLEWEFNDQPDQTAIWVDGTQVFSTPFRSPKPRASSAGIAAAQPEVAASPQSASGSAPVKSEALAQASGLVGDFTDIAFGFRLWGAAPAPFDIYYDDIAIGTDRIGPIQ